MIKKVFPILAFSIFASLLGSGIIAPLLPLYAENLGATGIWLGMIFSGFFISRAIIMPIAGRLSDRSGRKLFLSIGLLAYAIISLGYIWANSVIELSLVRFLQGISAGLILPIAQAYIGDITPEGEEGKWMGYFNAAFFAGFGFGPLMGGVLTDHFGMNVAFYSMAGLNLVAFLVVMLFLPESSYRKTGTASPSLLKTIGSSSIIKGIFSFRLTFSLGRGALATFLPIFAAFYIGLSPTLIGILIATNILTMSALQLYGGNIADRFNRRNLVIMGGAINLGYLVLVPFTGSFWQLFGVCVLGGFGGAIAIPSASALTIEEGRKFGMGLTVAISSTALSIGMAIGPLLAGVIADVISINSVFYFGATMGLLGIGVFSWFTRSSVIMDKVPATY